ncbi:MAG: hypothetical protein K9W44_04265 [Candidatus Lokiarchaeota archaeon]|nr:hypothetical protein [Candidatus Harpocratesius repetitus]
MKKKNKLSIMVLLGVILILPTFGFSNALGYHVWGVFVYSSQTDSDHDGLIDKYEEKFGTNPNGNYYLEDYETDENKDPYLFYQENYLKDLKIYPIWDIIYAKFMYNTVPKIKIGIIDCGYDRNHEDWGDNIDKKNANDENAFCDQATIPEEEDFYHGT